MSQSPRRALFLVLLASLVAVLLILRPLAIALFLASVLATALWPAHQRLCKALRGRKNLASGILITLSLILIIAPLIALTIFIVKQSLEAVHFISKTLEQSGFEGLLERLPEGIATPLRDVLDMLQERGPDGAIEQHLAERAGTAASVLADVLSATGSVLFQWVMMFIALFFFLSNKDALLQWIDDASPLGKHHTQELVHEFKLVTGAVLRSSILTALIQSVVAVIGYYIVSLPSPVFFGAITFVFALIPAIGAASVCLIAAGLLMLAGHPVSAIFLASWGLLVVGLVDNLVKPWLIKGEVQMHGAIVFFALIGGLAAFGVIGLLLGPLAVSLFIALLRIYRRDYGEDVPNQRS